MAENRELEIQSEINKLLLRESRDRVGFARKVEGLAGKFGSDLYPSLFFATVHLEFSIRTARKHWEEILHHWEWLNGHLERELDLRVALLDYFIDVNRRMKNPKIIEIKIFQKTQQETLVDELTQLYNYRYFVKALDQEIARAERYHAPLSLVMFDVDDFKRYNDTNGHLAGSRALRKLAKTIKKSLRDVDIVARYGGEEFTLILPETNKEGASAIAERIRQHVERTSFVRGKRQPLKKFTISGGVATLRVDAKTGSSLIKKADQALYRAKSLGKNRIARYVDERRSFERVNGTIQRLLSLASERGDSYVPRNISEGGILFQSHRSIPLGTNVRLSLNFKGRKTPVPFRAKIRRVEKNQKSKKFEIGASITQIREPEKKVIERFVRSLTQKTGSGSGT